VYVLFWRVCVCFGALLYIRCVHVCVYVWARACGVCVCECVVGCLCVYLCVYLCVCLCVFVRVTCWCVCLQFCVCLRSCTLLLFVCVCVFVHGAELIQHGSAQKRQQSTPRHNTHTTRTQTRTQTCTQSRTFNAHRQSAITHNMHAHTKTHHLLSKKKKERRWYLESKNINGGFSSQVNMDIFKFS